MLGRYAGGFAASIVCHLALAVWLGWPLTLPSSPAGGEPAVQVVLLPPNEDAKYPGLKPLDPAEAEWTPDPVPNDEEFAIADLQRIGGHFQVLFPFVAPGLAVDAFFPTLVTASPHLVFKNPFAPRRDEAKPERRQLEVTPARLQALVDKSWSRADRWAAFRSIRDAASAGDATDDTLARLIGMYREQNALQPYADGPIRDLRVWAQLGLAADHADFIGFIRQYAGRHPSTRVTTELLFLLDTIVQANEDALAVLVETNQPDDMSWTRQTNGRAFLLLRRIQQHYARALVHRKLTTRAGVETYHANVRLAILSGILRTTPDRYRADDALFLMGAILWRQDQGSSAVRVWRELTGEGATAFATAIGRIRAAVQPSAPNARNIDLILRNEQGRWLSFSDDRLRRFGYRFDRY